MGVTEPELSNGRWRCAITAPNWPALADAEVWFEPAAGRPDEPPAVAQQAAALALAADAAAVRERVQAALAAGYPDRLADCGFDPSDVREAAAAGPDGVTRLAQVIVWRPRGGQAAVGFDFAWDFDDEHGLGVRCVGDRVVAAGTAEVAHP